MLVRWENDFDSTEMEMLRKRSLCNVLSSKMEGNVEFLCSMFPKESTRVPQQSLIVDVLSTAASEASLANLQILAKGLINFFTIHNLIIIRKSFLYLFMYQRIRTIILHGVTGKTLSEALIFAST